MWSPQGSIFGPLLFMMYINDLSSNISIGQTFIYADDTGVVLSDRNPHQLQLKLNATMKELHTWFTANKLSLNVTNSNLMFFGTHHQLSSTKDIIVENEGCELEWVETVKYLGLKLDSKLTFTAHVDYVRSKTIGKVKLLGRISGVLDRAVSVTLYKTLILPIFDYCDYVTPQLRNFSSCP